MARRLFCAAAPIAGEVVQWGLVNFDCSGVLGWGPEEPDEGTGHYPSLFEEHRRSRWLVTSSFLTTQWLVCELFLGLLVDYRNWGLTPGRRFRPLKT